MKTLIVSSLLLFLLRCNAQTNAPENVEVLGFGIFKKTSSLDGGALSGRRHVAEALLVKFTTKVPAQIGTSFGFRVGYRGRSPGAPVHCTAKCLHPKLTDPTSGRTSEVEQWDASSVSGREEYIGYTLDNVWELVPGKWKIQLWVGPELMFEKTFTLYAPSA
jgi:hypothetical protein